MPVSIIKTQEKRLFSEAKLIKMLETNTFKEIIKILSETDYSYSIISLDSELMYEEILISELKRDINLLEKYRKKQNKK